MVTMIKGFNLHFTNKKAVKMLRDALEELVDNTDNEDFRDIAEDVIAAINDNVTFPDVADAAEDDD